MKFIKYIIFTFIIIFTAFFVYDRFFNTQRSHQELIGLKQKFKQVSERAASLEIQYLEQRKLKERAAQEWDQEFNALKGEIRMLSDATFLIRSYARENNEPDYYFETGPDGQSFIYQEIEFVDDEGNRGPPLGYVMIFSNGKIVSKVYNHEIEVQLISSRDPKTGKYSVLSKGNFILQDRHLGSRPRKPIKGKEDWTGRPFPLQISSGTALIDPTREAKTRSFRLEPKPNLGITVSPAGSRPFVGVHIASYGKSSNDLDWKFGHIGASIPNDPKDANLVIAPVSYRPSSRWLGNTHIAPHIEYGKSGLSGGFMINLGF